MRLLVVALLLLASLGCQRGASDESPAPVPGGQSDEQLRSYLAADRDGWSHPQEVTRTLGLRDGQVVADVGAGSGYWTVHLARAVAPSGKVLALDQDPYAIHFLRRRLADDPALRALPIEVRRVAGESAGLSRASVDLVFLCDVHVFLAEDTWVAPWLAGLRDALKPGGRLVVIENRTKPEGVPVTRAQMIKAFQGGGFTLKAEHDVVKRCHFMEFQ